MKNKKIWAVLGVVGLGTVLAALIWFALEPGTPKPVQAVQSEPQAPIVVPPEAEASSEFPTRPATAAETEKCESKEYGKLPSEWPVERTWKIFYSDNQKEDICLAIHKIRLKNNKIETIEDSIFSDEPAGLHSNTIMKYFKKEGYFAVGNSFMENSSMTLVNDRSGETFYLLCDEPVFSPQGLWVVSSCTTSSGESTPNQIGVFAVSESGLKQVYDSGETAATPEIVKWLDDNTISIETSGEDVDGKESNVILSQLQYRNGRWKMDPPMAPAKPISGENAE